MNELKNHISKLEKCGLLPVVIEKCQKYYEAEKNLSVIYKQVGEKLYIHDADLDDQYIFDVAENHSKKALEDVLDCEISDQEYKEMLNYDSMDKQLMINYTAISQITGGNEILEFCSIAQKLGMRFGG